MKYLLSLYIFLNLSLSAYSQINEKALIGAWMSTKMRDCVGVNCVDTTTSESRLDFLPDHQYKIYTPEGSWKGKWELKDSLIILHILDGVTLSQKISKLTNEVLDLEFCPYEDFDSVIEKHVYFYYFVREK